jgi:hypothetical protein
MPSVCGNPINLKSKPFDPANPKHPTFPKETRGYVGLEKKFLEHIMAIICNETTALSILKCLKMLKSHKDITLSFDQKKMNDVPQEIKDHINYYISDLSNYLGTYEKILFQIERHGSVPGETLTFRCLLDNIQLKNDEHYQNQAAFEVIYSCQQTQPIVVYSMTMTAIM